VSIEIQPWVIPAQAFIGESLSHFLGRFRRHNHISPSFLGEMAGVGAIIARWEKFHLNPFPSDAEFAGVGEILGVTSDRLRKMLPPVGVKMKCDPIRLCGACYQENPWHLMEWQYQSTAGCVSTTPTNRHQLRLLSKCPNCESRFPPPALWKYGCCDRCNLPFGEMSKWQKSY
jgi:hypothetical protein